MIGETLHVLLKYQSDIAKARKELVPDAVDAVTVTVAVSMPMVPAAAPAADQSCWTSSRGSSTSCARPGCRCR